MAPDHFARLMQLFQAAIDLDPSQRADFIAARTCEGDPLRRDLEDLLRRLGAAGSFLEPACPGQPQNPGQRPSAMAQLMRALVESQVNGHASRVERARS